MAVVGPIYNYERVEYYGLSSDTKPTGVSPGCTFWVYDTTPTLLYKTYDGKNWILYVTLS